MAVALPQLRVGEPVRHESLSVFPLFAEPDGEVEYLLADEAIASEAVVVQEVSEGGSVPQLFVENRGDTRVLFLEGEEMVGAKQNRILNTSVLAPAKSKLKIPVSCVEQGRWGYKSRHFGSSGSHSSSKLRRTLKASVNRSAKLHGSHASDQGAVWSEVRSMHASHGVESATTAMSDVFQRHANQVAEFQDKLPYVEGACGMAVAVAERIVAVDVFDKPATCQKVWRRLLSGVVFDALEAKASDQQPQIGDVERLLASTRAANWEQNPAVGEGEEYRAEFEQDHASALALAGTVVHGSVVAG